MLKAPILVPKTNKLEVRKIKDAIYRESVFEEVDA